MNSFLETTQENYKQMTEMWKKGFEGFTNPEAAQENYKQMTEMWKKGFEGFANLETAQESYKQMTEMWKKSLTGFTTSPNFEELPEAFRKPVTQMMDVWKQGLENTFSSFEMLQEHNEKLFKEALVQKDLLQEENRKVLAEAWENWKKGQETYEENLREQMKKIEEFFTTKKAA